MTSHNDNLPGRGWPWLPWETREGSFLTHSLFGEDPRTCSRSSANSGQSQAPTCFRALGAVLANPPPLPPPGLSHLRQRPLCLPQLDEDPEWDTEHGGQGHQPADAVAPGGVGIDVVVLERLVFDQEEDKDALPRDGERSLGARLRRQAQAQACTQETSRARGVVLPPPPAPRRVTALDGRALCWLVSIRHTGNRLPQIPVPHQGCETLPTPGALSPASARSGIF